MKSGEKSNANCIKLRYRATPTNLNTRNQFERERENSKLKWMAENMFDFQLFTWNMSSGVCVIDERRRWWRRYEPRIEYSKWNYFRGFHRFIISCFVSPASCEIFINSTYLEVLSNDVLLKMSRFFSEANFSFAAGLSRILLTTTIIINWRQNVRSPFLDGLHWIDISLWNNRTR